jgi:hypothetical protein
LTKGDLSRLVSAVPDLGHLLDIDGETLAVFPTSNGKLLVIGRDTIAVYNSIESMLAGVSDLSLPYPCRCSGLAGWLGRLTRNNG